MNKYFHEDMTANEARTLLYTLVDQKTKEEMEEVWEEYSKVIDIILDRNQKKYTDWFAAD
ncbi:hypothetical protein [Neglectibacter caecimuris]|uniref:hypothetical protein n=1 Tax=Neglectibacter caecimuris TaxID=3093658 RepID=UPI002AC958A6|nr:hypothetical protein [Neglectibacter sp. M00184]